MTRTLTLLGLLAPLALLGCGEKDGDDSSATDDSSVTDDTGSTTDDSSTDDSSTDDSSTDDSSADDSSADDSGTTEDTEIAKVQRGEYEVGATVTIHGWAAHEGTRYGVHVLDGRSDTYSGVYVYWGTDLEVTLARGDEVEITGLVEEYATGESGLTLTEVIVEDAANVTVISSGGTLPEPVLLTTAQLADDATAEMYEGALVKVEGVNVTNPDLGFGEWELNGEFRVDDLLYDFGVVSQGDSFGAIIGHVYYGYDSYKLTPRDADDFVGYTPVPCSADKCVEDLSAGDLVVTEFMPNPSGDVGNDDYNEWIEVYNASGGTVNLSGLVVGDDAEPQNQGSISVELIVAAGDYVVLGKGDGTQWGYTTFTADAWYGGNPALGNGGDQIWLKRAPDEANEDAIDVAAAYGDGNSGIAWQLDASTLSATDNDDSAFWCELDFEGAPLIEASDYGTPGAANVSCPAAQ